MKTDSRPTCGRLAAAALFALPALPATSAQNWDMLVWGNRSPDMNAASSWDDAAGNVSAVAPSSNAVLFFATNAVVQPVLTSSMTVIGLHFHACTNSTSSDVPRVHKADGCGGWNYSGYRITGAEGAVLTLDGNTDNKGWTRDVYMATKGTNTIAVPVAFTDNRKHHVYSSGGRLVFEAPVSTHATQEFVIGSQAYGRVVFAAPNPDFVPTYVNIQGDLAIADPRAMEAVPKFTSGCWAWSTSVNGFSSEKACHLINETGEPAVITATAIELGDHDGFGINGGPFPMSNTVFRANMRDGKAIGGGTADIVVKEIVCTKPAEQKTFNKHGSGTLVNLGGFCTNSIATNVLQVSAGTYVAMTPAGLSRKQNVLNSDVYPDSPIGTRIGVDFDYAPLHSSDDDGDLRFYHYRRPAGFAAASGIRHVNLYGGVLLRRSLKNSVLGGEWRQFANTMGFGAEGTAGTVVLDNDIDLNNATANGECSVSVWDGDAFVDARFAGMVTNAPDSKPEHRNVRLSKKEAGVLALDGPCYVTADGRVYAGGLLVNSTIESKYVVYDGAWIGGTGRTLGLEIQSGGGLRPGEQGGEMEVSGAMSLADGARIVADLGPGGVHGCANFTGSGVAYSAAGGVVVEMVPLEGLKFGTKVKILDWSGATPTDVSAFDLSRYTISYDETFFSSAKLLVQGDAIYLAFGVINHHPTMMILR